MPKKRCLPKTFHTESPKKRLRRRTPSEETSPNAQTLKEARNILRNTEKENIQLRVERVEKTVNRAILFIGRDLRKHNESLAQKILKKYQKKSVHFPVNYNACMGFIDGYTGVKKRTEATICWDEKESKNWLNRQRANVYGPTLFKEALDFIDNMSYEIAQASTTHSRHLRRMGICKLLVELLRVNYKPKSKQAAEKRLICANSIKHQTFRNRLIRLVGWQDITKKTTLESVAERAEKEYQTLVTSCGACDEMSADEAEESDDDDQSSEDDDEGDAEMEDEDKSKIATTRSQRNLPPPSLIPKIQTDRKTFVPPPVNSLDTSTMPPWMTPHAIPLPQMSAVPAPTPRTNLVATELRKRVSDLEEQVAHLKCEVLKHRARMECWAKFVPPELRKDLCPEVVSASADVRMTSSESTCTVPALPLPYPDAPASVMGSFGVPSYPPNWFDAFDSLSAMGSAASDAMTEHSALDANESWAGGIGPQ